ncbi:MAG: hypothetical protein MAG451_02274 [Anaerolineales bacterium]|nr:hypothetical protein [Anaerolineales bacterium]
MEYLESVFAYHLNISGLCRSKWYFDPTIYQIVLHVPPYIEKICFRVEKVDSAYLSSLRQAQDRV